MKYLLDTHAFLFWMIDSPELPARVRALLQEHRSQVAFSVLSAWEMTIKTASGKLSGVSLTTLTQDIRTQGFPVLEFTLDHVQVLASLPSYHQDPFDRGLIATALSENLILLTRDSQFKRYGVEVLW